MITFVRGGAPQIGPLPGAQAGNLTTEYEIHDSGFYLVLTTNIGLTVVWDHGTRVYVNLQPTFQGKTFVNCVFFYFNLVH